MPRFSRRPAPTRRQTGHWLLSDPFSGLWLRPWFDQVALRGVIRWYLPLSRAWAAALVAGRSPERFWHELPGADSPPAGLSLPLALVARRRQLAEEADRHWYASFFDNAASDPARRVMAESRRRAAAEMLMLARGSFVPLALQRRLPAVKWSIEAPDEVQRRHGYRLDTAEAAFPPPRLPKIVQSHGFRGPPGEQFWLRFPSPGREAGGTAWAHVYQPTDAADPPTVIFLHGIGMEQEFLPDAHDPLPALTHRGVRIIRPEGPWHGRRRLPGYYGGEPAMARGPGGFLDLFEAWVAEIAVLVAWARATGRGRVALGGLSLGALTSQLVATAAQRWPAEMRPDALLLVATSGRISDVVTASSLGRGIGLPQRMAAHGWTAEAMASFLPLAEPQGEPALPPERIVMVLGSTDDVTPFAGGLALADAWKVPARNRFVWQRGHFSAGLGIAADTGPLSRLLELCR